MRPLLMDRDRDFEITARSPSNAGYLIQDLDLETLFQAMSGGDRFLHEVVAKAVLSSLTDPEAIRYRQAILRDCLEQAAVVRQMYDLAKEAVAGEKKIWGVFSKTPQSILHRSTDVMEHFLRALRLLRRIADEHGAAFRSEGLTRFIQMLQSELDDAYFTALEDELRQLRFRKGVLISAELGEGNAGTAHTLRRPFEDSRRWRDRILPRHATGYSFEVAERDESGLQTLGQLRGRGINRVAEVLARAADHILGFFSVLQAELGFYVGCLNLRYHLGQKGEPVCMPECRAAGEAAPSSRGLYDVCLTLHVHPRVVGNDIEADDAQLVIITGANQGGKSTFLRGVGLAYLMMQCGMFVAAESFAGAVCDGLFTHFKREEDATMESGKLDEELRRLSRIADRIGPRSVLLCNESFASTNEWEGSEIGREVIGALLQADVRVFLVTHLFELARGYHQQRSGNVLFLRAERHADGSRTFRILPAEPLPTSYGKDLYERILGDGNLAVSALSAGGA